MTSSLAKSKTKTVPCAGVMRQLKASWTKDLGHAWKDKALGSYLLYFTHLGVVHSINIEFRVPITKSVLEQKSLPGASTSDWLAQKEAIFAKRGGCGEIVVRYSNRAERAMALIVKHKLFVAYPACNAHLREV